MVIAPDSFGGTLSATAAAEAVAAGWRVTAAADTLTLLPLADGGTGFVDVLHAALGGERRQLQVSGPLDEPVTAGWLRVGATAYVESAAACGLHLLPRRDPDVARRATTRGVGELVAAALGDPRVSEIVIGLGGSATTDGGAGLLAALGVVVVDAAGRPLPDGGAALVRADRFAPAVPGDGPQGDARGPAPLRPGVRLVAAVDVDNPLLGRHGAATVFGPQKGADAAAVAELDAALTTFADVLAAWSRDVRDEPGAGAGGGLGAALLAVGAQRVSGAGLVRELVGLDAAIDEADLVITGEGSFDWQSLRGKLVTAVARGAADRGVPCLVLAGQVGVGRREAASVGVDAAYSVADDAGGVEASLADPAATLARLAARVATRWSR